MEPNGLYTMKAWIWPYHRDTIDAGLTEWQDHKRCDSRTNLRLFINSSGHENDGANYRGMRIPRGILRRFSAHTHTPTEAQRQLDNARVTGTMWRECCNWRCNTATCMQLCVTANCGRPFWGVRPHRWPPDQILCEWLNWAESAATPRNVSLTTGLSYDHKLLVLRNFSVSRAHMPIPEAWVVYAIIAGLGACDTLNGRILEAFRTLGLVVEHEIGFVARFRIY